MRCGPFFGARRRDAGPPVVSWTSSATSSHVIIAGRFAAQCGAGRKGRGCRGTGATLIEWPVAVIGRWAAIGHSTRLLVTLRPLVNALWTAAQRALPSRRSGRFIRSGNYAAVITRRRLIYAAVRSREGTRRAGQPTTAYGPTNSPRHPSPSILAVFSSMRCRCDSVLRDHLRLARSTASLF
uniref:Uncharacterized protein n=1 Tax=Plectus sambesii TaxID=2011161 RepID=A0A914UPV6_9BILA